MPTVQAVIDNILTAIPYAPYDETVDVIKTGDPSQEVTGIVTTFLASCEVLQKAVNQGANFVITREPIFYNHLDETDWLANDPVYRAKRKLIDDHGLVIWRFHDYWHSHQPDGILTGVAGALNWSSYRDPASRFGFTIPATRFDDLTADVAGKLGSRRTLTIGRPDMLCSKIALLVGAPGGKWQIEALRGDVDVLIAGEINEWETCEYVRDALLQGLSKGLIVIGHQVSEEAGMAYLVEWLRPRFPDLKIAHIPSGDPFAQTH
jgi:putative NIF3 family GTP cyclohydrolase 1 type 2